MKKKSNVVGNPPSFDSSDAPPVPPRFAPHLWKVAAIGLGTIALFTSILLGERYATEAVDARERMVGNDLIASVDRILTRVSSRHQGSLTALAGRPCADVQSLLMESPTYIGYVRAVALVLDGRVYCSSSKTSIDLPLSAYLVPIEAPFTLSLLEQTPLQPDVPVIALFRKTGQRTGILYIIEGEYISAALAHGIRYGVRRATLSVMGAGMLSDQGVFGSPEMVAHPTGIQVSSTVWPYSISLSASKTFVSETRWIYGFLFGSFGVLFDALIGAAYFLTFAPRRLLLREVRRGLKRNEMHMVYQPVVDIATRYPVGLEALLRWTHPRWGAISPAKFMGEVESSSLLASVTRFVLRTAGEEVGRRTLTPPMRIAVNVAPKDFERRTFVAEVLEVSDKLPPGFSLVLEVTERFLLNESPRILSIFETLKAHKIKFSIDDFGTQYSNLDLLSRFPFDFVKIDRQFVKQVDSGGVDLIKGILSVAKHFHLQVIAEGIETEAQHQALLELGVPFGQGYLYQRPMRASDFTGKIATPVADILPEKTTAG